MIILNFSHPITAVQLAAIEQLVQQKVDRVVDVKTQLEHEQSFAEQTQALVNSIGLSSQEWQSLQLLVNLPSMNFIAALVLAEPHGRMGYFPAALRLRPISGSNPPQYEAAEIINLQAVRDVARQAR